MTTERNNRIPSKLCMMRENEHSPFGERRESCKITVRFRNQQTAGSQHTKKAIKHYALCRRLRN